jgi:hypothetical protein
VALRRTNPDLLIVQPSPRTLHDPFRRLAVPQRRDGPFLLLPCHRSRESRQVGLVYLVGLVSLVCLVHKTPESVSRVVMHGMQEASPGATCATLRFSHYSNGRTRALARWGSIAIVGSGPCHDERVDCAMVAGGRPVHGLPSFLRQHLDSIRMGERKGVGSPCFSPLHRTSLLRHARSFPRCSTIRSAPLPTPSCGRAPLFHCPVISLVSAGESLPGSGRMSSCVPIMMATGRSVSRVGSYRATTITESHRVCLRLDRR